MKNLIKPLLIITAFSFLGGCANFMPTLTDEHNPERSASVKVSSYDRVTPTTDTLSVVVSSKHPERLEEGFDMQRTKKFLENFLKKKGFKISPNGMKVLVEIKYYNTDGKATMSSGGGTTGAAGTLVGGLGASIAQGVATQVALDQALKNDDYKKHNSGRGALTISVPDMNFSVDVQYQSTISSEAHPPSYHSEIFAKIAEEFILKE